MKLLDLIYGMSSITRNVANVIRYPFQIASQTLQTAARHKLEEVEVPLPQSKAERRQANLTTTRDVPQTTQAVVGQVATQTVTRSITPSVSPLVGKPLLGRRGKYQVELLLRDGERIRIYRGIRVVNNTPVLIKEYLLTNFNSREVKQAKEKLERLDSLSFRSGGVQDFRLVVPSDTFVDQANKCGYVITTYASEDRLSLREYLLQEQRKGYLGLPPLEVRQILAQVLQTLWFMHNHPVRFSDGVVQRGIAHGNLSLDSLLRVPNTSSNGGNNIQFYIYVNDLGIWKEPFQFPAQAIPATDTNQLIKRDLIGLGIVGFYLLVGETTGYPDRFSDPRAHPYWDQIPDESLKAIIRQLLGLDRSDSFSSADEVRQALERSAVVTEQAPDSTPPESVNQAVDGRWWVVLAALLMLLMAVGMARLGWQLLTQIWPDADDTIEQFIPGADSSQLESVEVPNDSFQYGISNSWRDALGRGRVGANQTFAAALTERNARFGRYQEDNRLPHDDPTLLAKLRNGQIDFILGTWDESTQAELKHKIVAYDGVVVFVAFSDPARERNVAKALQGKLSFRDLQKLYADDFEWKLPQPLKKEEMDKALYAPDDDVAIKLFEQQVLQRQPLIDSFQNRLDNRLITRQNINLMVGNILQDFENHNTVGIGFGRLSKILGQCSVYPLAIGSSGQEVQPITTNGKAITPDFDLCDLKGSYAPDANLFAKGRYPLIYPLSVIYTSQGEEAAQAFIQALQTDEGQCLLTEAGLVAIRPIRKPGECADAQ